MPCRALAVLQPMLELYMRHDAHAMFSYCITCDIDRGLVALAVHILRGSLATLHGHQRVMFNSRNTMSHLCGFQETRKAEALAKAEQCCVQLWP